MRNKMKVGLAILIALAFIIPSGSIMADDKVEKSKAVETTTTGEYPIFYIGENGPMAQGPGDVSVLGLVSPELGGPFGHSVQAGTYPINISLFNEPGMGDATVKAFVDIYEKSLGEEHILYETSFEDNWDIYNNWVQIDEDCALGGYYDSWSWSDARSKSGSHSMKSTMYDIYKGNQDDYLQMTRGIDLSGQDGVKVEFYTWVEGDGTIHDYYDNYLPYDWLGFMIGDGSGFINPYTTLDFLDWNTMAFFLDGSYVFFDTTLGLYNYAVSMDYTPIAEEAGGGWWKVNFTAPLAYLSAMGIDITDFRIQFEWHTDPQFQYEGAYVDDVKIICIDNTEVKVFQSHSQGPFVIPEGISNFEFPMPWTAVGDDTKETMYDVKVWIEVLDPDHTSMNDWPDYLDILVCVEDWFDTEVDNLRIESSVGGTSIVPGTGVLEYGEDAHIMADVHLDGTLPAENIPVTATAKKVYWETVWENDCEGLNPLPDTNGEVQVTTKDAYSGSKSLGWFNDLYFEYTDGAFNYAFGPKINFKDAEEVYFDFYYKCNLGPGDVVRPAFLDSYSNYVLGMSAGQCKGWKDEWVGPMQPASVYVRTNLLSGFEYFYSIGLLRDAYGNQVWEVPIGFYQTGVNDGVTSDPLADANDVMWSGAFIDDLSVTKKVIGEEVWSQTVIIPGPMEPCDTVEVQFEWEDVPYSNYQICVCAEPDGACGNLEDPCECADILVVRDLEKAHWKEVESIDYTSELNGEWGICSSDYNNYLATNADSNNYPDDAHAIAELCIDGEKGIDVPSGATDLFMCFDAWWELDAGYDYVFLEVAEFEANDYLDWIVVDFFTDGSYVYGGVDEWVTGYCVDLLSPFVTIPSKIQVRFRLFSDEGWNYRGMMIDNLEIPDIDFLDTMDNLDNWCSYAYSLGNFWTNPAPGEWCGTFPTVVDNALVWATEIADAYEAFFTWETDYNFVSGSGLVQVSGDGGFNWFTIAEYTGSSGGYISGSYTLTPFVGEDILIRFLAQGEGTWCVKNLLVTGKKDTDAPITTITMTGTMTDAGWYSTPVSVKITAVDEGAGMGAIHYILDGTKKVVEGSTASFTVSGNGAHNLEFWGVDKVGNEEVHKTVPTFRIDAGSPPTVAITEPGPGLYLFGNKLLSLSKVFIIGAFTVEATASDAESGVYRVQFLLDGDVIAEDTVLPYSAYCAVKHMGAGTLKVIAEDFSGNTAEDTLDITYYKFL
jgi:hypothetical protein